MGKYSVLLLLIGLLCTTHSYSQVKVRGSIRGVLVDSVGSHQVLSNASVSLTAAGGDSTDAEFIITDKKGAFAFKGLSAGVYKLVISYEGYDPIQRSIRVSDSVHEIDLATLYMQRSNAMLEAVVVQRPPITVKKDTVEYNAGMYATKPNAVAEDLLKKMPGIQVDKSGTVTAHGETVTRVLVNGKRFFSDDPKLATRNLPPDVIDKIQVFDDLSDQSKFTGFDDGNRVKTINIVTKKDRRQGYFGKFVAGAGTDGRYDESINLHRFDNETQMSVLGQANDVNKQNFTPGDIFGNGFGGGRRGGGGGGGGGGSSNGITSVWAGGANFRSPIGPKTDLYGSYFYNNNHVSSNSSDSSIKPIMSESNPDSSNISSGHSFSLARTESHRASLNWEQRFDSSNSLIFRPGITWQQSTPQAASDNFIVSNNGNPITRSIAYSNGFTSGFNINGSNLQLRHKFKKAFRTISLDVNTTANNNDGRGFNYAVNDLYQVGRTDTIHQYYLTSTRAMTISPTLSYTEPIAKDQILEINFNHSYTNNKTYNNTYDFVDSVHDYSKFDSLFSNSYKFTSHSDRLTANYRIQNLKFNFSAGSGVQWTTFDSYNTTKDIRVSHSFVNLTPTVNFQYLFSRTTHLRLNYSGRTGTPTPNQLQPLTTTTDQINYQVGNPALRPQFTHNLRMLFTSFDPSTQRVIFATVNASTTVNDIQSAVVLNRKGGQTSTYVNLDGTYSLSGYFNYGFALKKPKSNLNLITNVNYSQSQSLRSDDSIEASKGNYLHLYTRNTTLSETISWTTNIKKNFDMNFNSTTTYNIGKSSSITGTPYNSNSFSQVLSAEVTAYTNNGWLIATTFDYTYTNTGGGAKSGGYNASVPLLNPSIAKQLFKKKNGELRLTVFDLLNQNTSVSKTVSGGNIAYNRNTVLTRYAMLTFTYNLNNFAGANQRRMPGMFRGMRGDGPPGGGGGGGFREGRGPGGLYMF